MTKSNTHQMCLRSLMAAAAISLALICGCSASTPDPAQPQTVTLYTSADDALARVIADAFTRQTGIRVDVLGDTEATKTTGLVTRIQAEMDHPVCDVWWSSEPMGTILLDQSGALEPGAMRGLVGGDWPVALHAENWSWVGIAMRARVIAYATDRVGSAPTTLAALTDPKYKGRVGMARPQFGTTRIHMALLAQEWGMEPFNRWLGAMKSNRLRLYDGNARVVQAIALGEIDVGLTDTDDVWAGQSNGWKVDLVYETRDETPDPGAPFPSAGPTLIPNTVAIVAGAPHRDAARELAEFLVSPGVEELLYESGSHNTPVHPALRARHAGEVLDIATLPDYVGASGRAKEAMDACERVLISP